MTCRVFNVLILFPLFTFGQSNYPLEILGVLDSGPEVNIRSQGLFSIDTAFSESGSSWEIDWEERKVYDLKLAYTHPTNNNKSYVLRMGKGGQVYSFRSSGFGEAIPPQWRPSFDTNGDNTTDPGPSTPVQSHHGNWAPWNDEVWHFVGSDQNDELDGRVKTKNLHQAGSYMNNFAHRASDLTETPFYSPLVQSHTTDTSFSAVYWIQSENPSYVYDEFSDCDVCHPDNFQPSVLVFQKYTNLGEGIIQVDFLIYNYHRTRGIDYWNIPFMGIRNSSLPYAFVSNSTENDTTYDQLNTLPGHPAANNPNPYLPEFNAGAVIRTSGNNSASSGWFAFSNDATGDGPSLGIITAKSTDTPRNGYGDFRYGTAMSNPFRDVTILTRRAIGGAEDPQTGLKPWGIIGGQSIKGRYFLMVNSSIEEMASEIHSYDLTNKAFVEIVSIDSLYEHQLFYTFNPNGDGIFEPVEVNASNYESSFNSRPFTGSYPVYLIQTNNSSILTSDPFHLTLKPYDGTIQNMELLGFQSMPHPNQTLSTTVSSNETHSRKINVYPNPARNEVFISTPSGLSLTAEIFDINGKRIEVKSKTVDQNLRVFNIENLEPGVYFIRINSYSAKFIKK